MMDVEVKDPVVQSAINDIIRIINNIENYDATFYYLNDFTVNIKILLKKKSEIIKLFLLKKYQKLINLFITLLRK